MNASETARSSLAFCGPLRPGPFPTQGTDTDRHGRCLPGDDDRHNREGSFAITRGNAHFHGRSKPLYQSSCGTWVCPLAEAGNPRESMRCLPDSK